MDPSGLCALLQAHGDDQFASVEWGARHYLFVLHRFDHNLYVLHMNAGSSASHIIQGAMPRGMLAGVEGSRF